MRCLFLIACFLIGSTTVQADHPNRAFTPLPDEPFESAGSLFAPEDHTFLPSFDENISDSPEIADEEIIELEPSKPRSPSKPSISTVETPGEALIDLRPPIFSFETSQIQAEPRWLNNHIDDHLLLWKDVRDDTVVIPRLGTDFGLTSLGFKFDFDRDEGPWWMAGFFGWNFLSGPTTAAVDAQTYDLGVELNYARKIGQTWGVNLSIAPTFSTDFQNKSSESFRLVAGGLLTYQADQDTKLVAGLSYLDRPDMPFIPIAGLKLSISESLELDLLVPRPRLAWRFDETDKKQSWIYTAGEVGGNSWAIEREFNQQDQFGYRDLRWVWGVETQEISGSRRVFELGYVFNRKITFEHGPGNERVKDSILLQWGRLY